MPDPRIRRPRPPGSRPGRPRRDAAPPEPGTDEQLRGDDAETAEVAAAALAAEDVAGDGAPSGGGDEVPAADVDAAAEADAAADADAPVDDEGEAPAPEGEPLGWFRDESIDETPGASVPPPAQDAPAVSDEPTVVFDAPPDLEDVEPDRPVLEPVTPGEPPRRGGRVRGFLVGIVTIAVVGGVGFVAGLMLPTILPGPGVGTSSPSPSVQPTATAAPTPEATPAPTATPTATPSPSVEPTATPSPAPTPLVYVVKAGDQLQRIADRYGVTVKAIQEANNVADPNLIRVGQKLIIPLPASPTP